MGSDVWVYVLRVRGRVFGRVLCVCLVVCVVVCGWLALVCGVCVRVCCV